MHQLIPRFSSICIGLLLSIHLLAQQSYNIVKGRIVNEDRLPIVAATVQLLDATKNNIQKTTSDSLGYYTLHTTMRGRLTINVYHIGYKDYQMPLLTLTDTTYQDIMLVPAANKLESVLVTGKKRIFEVDGGTIIFNVENSIAAQDVSALEVLKRAPGVAVENERDITLNGMNSVQIRIDGRITHLSGNDLIDILKSMSSNTIQSIEIINSPSAKYDATGTAGIINIKTKKNLIKGFNGNITSTLAYGISPKQLQNIGFNYRLNKVNIFANYNHTLGNYHYIYGTNRQQNDRDYDSHTDDIDKRQKMMAQVGVDYYLNDKNTLGFSFNSNFIFGGGLTDTHTDISNLNATTIQESLDAKNDYYKQLTTRYNFNANYKYEDTLGRSLNVDLEYGSFDKSNKNLQSNLYNNYLSQKIQENYYRTFNTIDIDLKGIKIDYSMPFVSGKLETGLKYSQVGSGNEARFYHLTPTVDSLDNRRSNRFQFDEHIAAAYVNYNRIIGKYKLEGGLRVENSKSRGSLSYTEDLTNLNQEINKTFTNIFPFISATMTPNKNISLSLSYAKRIERPAYQDLNPFIYMLDELSFWQGNPFLKPAITHRLSFLFALKKATIITLNYAFTDNFTAKVTDTLEREKIVIISKNVGTQQHWSLALTQNIKAAKYWDITFNGLLYYTNNKVSLDAYRNFNLSQLAGRMSLTQSFLLPYKLKAELLAIYNSNRLNGANTFNRAVSQVDIALQKNVLNDKGSLRLAVIDIYKGNKSRYTQDFPGYSSISYGYYESRQVRISFSYKFSSGMSKTQRVRKSALESESGRI